MSFLDAIFVVLVTFLLAYLIRHYLFTITALYHHNSQFIPEVQGLPYQPKVSVLIPAHNEERVIERILRRMTELTYPKEKLEIIVIDDGSRDQTGEISEKISREYNFIKVIHRDPKRGGKGKAHALNEGFKHATGEIVYCFDADYYPQQDILEKLTAGFIDPEVGGVQGRVVVLNEADTIVTRLVTLERIGGYRVDQVAREKLRLIPQFGGTVGGFRKQIIDQLGGWDPKILAEDTDLTFRIYLAGYRIRYVNEAECYEEAVRDWRSYWHQRYRWSLGHMQCAFKHMWTLIKSRKLRLREKLDGFFLLNVYFVLVLVGLAWVIGLVSYFTQPQQWVSPLWVVPSIFIYSSVGNFAPFFEVGIGAYLDQRTRVYRLLPLLFVTFAYNVLICNKALIDLCTSKIAGTGRCAWVKTPHDGSGNSYIEKRKDEITRR